MLRKVWVFIVSFGQCITTQHFHCWRRLICCAKADDSNESTWAVFLSLCPVSVVLTWGIGDQALGAWISCSKYQTMHRVHQNMGAVCSGCYACSILDLIWIKILEALHLTDWKWVEWMKNWTGAELIVPTPAFKWGWIEITLLLI